MPPILTAASALVSSVAILLVAGVGHATPTIALPRLVHCAPLESPSADLAGFVIHVAPDGAIGLLDGGAFSPSPSPIGLSEQIHTHHNSRRLLEQPVEARYVVAVLAEPTTPAPVVVEALSVALGTTEAPDLLGRLRLSLLGIGPQDTQCGAPLSLAPARAASGSWGQLAERVSSGAVVDPLGPPLSTHDARENRTRALRRLAAGCERGTADDCTRAGELRLAPGADRDLKQASTWLSRACELHVAQACREAIVALLLDERRAANGLRQMLAACASGVADVCPNQFDFMGKATEQEQARIARLVEAACARDHDRRACGLPKGWPAMAGTSRR